MGEYSTLKNRSFSTAILFSLDSLKKRESIFLEGGTLSDYQVRFSNGATVMYPTLDEVIQQPNSPDNRIVGMAIRADNHSGESMLVTIKENFDTPLEYTVAGTQVRVAYLSQKVEEWVSASRRWYWWRFASSMGSVIAIAAIILPFPIASLVAGAFTANKKPSGIWPLLSLAIIYGLEYGIHPTNLTTPKTSDFHYGLYLPIADEHVNFLVLR